MLQSLRTFVRDRGVLAVFAGALTHSGCAPQAQPPVEPMPVRVAVLAMFERGEDQGDTPGELQLWVDNAQFDDRWDNPAGHHPIWVREDGLIATAVGVGHSKAAASVATLLADPRFDLSKAYWIIAGIAGVDPENASIGSVAIARYVVDGSLAHEIDARDIPADWATGLLPLGSSGPYEPPPRDRGSDLTMVYRLNPALAEWAHERTVDVALPDSDEMAARREDFAHPQARTPPRVLIGDVLSSGRFWHGRRMNDFANRWVRFWTRDAAPPADFVMSSMEDAGSLQALAHAASAERVDWARILVLRSASNYTMESEDMTTIESLRQERGASFTAYRESLQAVYRVGRVVVDELMSGWERFEVSPPR